MSDTQPRLRPTVTSASSRVDIFLDARRKMSGIDQNIITSIGTHDGPLHLTAEDLRLLVAAGGLHRNLSREVDDLHGELSDVLGEVRALLDHPDQARRDDALAALRKRIGT